jgi:hypothetical protein
MRAKDMVWHNSIRRLRRYTLSALDAELRITTSRLTASWSQTELAPDVATLLEALLASQGQHEG